MGEEGNSSSAILPTAVRVRPAVDRREVRRVAREDPLLTDAPHRVGARAGSTQIVGLIVHPPNGASFNRHDGIDRPTLEQLSEALPSRDGIIDREREAMTDVKITAPIQRSGIRAVDRDVEAIALI